MNASLIDRVLAEYEHQRVADADPTLEAVRAAIFVEDVFGLTIPDELIDPSVLVDPVALRTFLASAVPTS